MTLEARKIEFLKEFLKLQSEETISRLEDILRNELNSSNSGDYEPMSEEDLNNRIDKSESDFRNKKFKSSKDLLAKYK
jgi:hypothetical protein